LRSKCIVDLNLEFKRENTFQGCLHLLMQAAFFVNVGQL
jgi:hypothetical protein